MTRPDIDISSLAFWRKEFSEREKSFATLRMEAPVSWHAPVEVPYTHDEKGFWAVTRAKDITTVSMNPEIFQSRQGIALDPTPPGTPKGGAFFLEMDAPEHLRYRRLVSAAFTPKAIRKISDRIERNAEAIVDSLIGAGEVDFVEECSSRLPLTTVSDIVGVPESERAQVATAANQLVGGGDAADVPPEQALAFKVEQYLYLRSMGASLAAHRRRSPSDDLMTNLVQAEIDGARLTDDDIGDFMVLMSVAGNDTTKQTTTRVALALHEHPEQRDWLMADFDGRISQAVEEFVRYASPVMQFTRTAAEDTELNGMPIASGDKVALFYCSGNRDDSVFVDPEKFDLSRPTTSHVGFGGGGPHFCLGNGVAKIQLRALFNQLLTRVPHIEFGEPQPLMSNFINGIARLPAYIR